MDMPQKYLIDGTAVKVVEQCENGFLIHRLYEDGETGELIADEKIRWVEQVFETAPTVKLSDEVLRLSEKVASLHIQVSEQQAAVHEGQTKHRALLAKFQRDEKLRLLEDFLDGKITHFAHLSPWHNSKIAVREKEKGGYYEDGTKLLVLFGNSKGDLNWRINLYKDGSGNYEDVVPCTSYEQAKEVLANFLLGLFAEGKGEDRDIEAAQKHGIDIPQEFVGQLRARKAMDKQNHILRLEGEIAEEREAIASLNGK